MTIRTLDSLAVTGRRVFLRVDFNVPLDGGRIQDATRIRETLPTLNALQDKGARVILASHLGRPKGRNPAESLLPVGEYLSEELRREVIFPEDCIGDSVRKLAHDLKEGQVMLLENLRFHPEEEANEPHFSGELASLAEVYLTDAFGTLHRAHASTVGMVSHFKEKGAGRLIEKELKMLGKLLSSPERPFYALLGGAKVSDKIGVIENLLNRVDGLFLGGALAYTFLRAKGVEVGRSKVEEEKLYLARRILDRAREKQVPLFLPIDHKVVERVEPAAEVRVSERIPEGTVGVDIGPGTVAEYRRRLADAKTIFWNGPMGVFEMAPFAEGTYEIARMVAREGATSVVGGGESVTACRQAGVADWITHLSTGGGATLEYLEGKELPGLKVLEG